MINKLKNKKMMIISLIFIVLVVIASEAKQSPIRGLLRRSLGFLPRFRKSYAHPGC